MAFYRPQSVFNVPLVLLIPTYTTVNGVRKKIYPEIADGILINGSFKTYGGTETAVNGLLAVEDTADIETWFRPDISSDCAIAIAGTNKCYEIIGEPENINLRNMWLKFKVRRIKGGV